MAHFNTSYRNKLGVQGIQLFREILSEKVHATIPKGIGGGVVSSSLFFEEISKNGKRGHGRLFVSAKGKQQK